MLLLFHCWRVCAAGPLHAELETDVVLQYFSSPDVPTTFGTVRPYITADARLTRGPLLELYASAWMDSETGRVLNLDELGVLWHVLPEDQLSLSLGRQYLPYGHYSTMLASAPLTLDFGSLRSHQAIVLSSETGVLNEAVYWFDGSEATAAVEEESDNGYGFRLEKSIESEDLEATIGYDYISNVAGAEDFFPGDTREKLSAQGIYLDVEADQLSMILERLSLIGALAPGDLRGDIDHPARPAVTRVEWTLSFGDKGDLSVALNKTRGGEQLGLFRRATSIGWRRSPNENATISVEIDWLTDMDGYTDRVIGLQWVLSL